MERRAEFPGCGELAASVQSLDIRLVIISLNSLQRSAVAPPATSKGHPDYVSPGVVAAIRLLAMTGTRCGEIVGLVHGPPRARPDALPARSPASKTGAKIIPLSPPAVELLRQLERNRGEREDDGEGEDTRPPSACVAVDPQAGGARGRTAP
jgi:integrase